MRQHVQTGHILLLLLVVVLLGLVPDASLTMAAGADAANAVIDWWTTSGGGGPGSSSNFTLHSSIGQPDAGTGTSESYTMVGGILAGAVTANEQPPDYTIFLPVVIK